VSNRYDDALLQEVRDRNHVVQVVSEYVSLKKAGRNHKGLCPFHNEKTPSFHVNEERQSFYCFGCQTGGDIISFIREIHGFSFHEAVRHLANRAGLQLPENDWKPGQASPKGPALSAKHKDSLYSIGRHALRFYVDSLASLEGKPCRTYLRERGIEHDMVERFALGFAPNRWDGLAHYLSRNQIDMKLAETSGLIVPRKDSKSHYDRFRNRLIFPIRNLAGKVIAYGGRILPTPDSEGDDAESTSKEAAKYINSPETPIYDKGKTLFGLYEARQSIRQTGHAIIVEGNIDVIRMAQFGFTQVVAPMGTALTPEQCRLIRRFVARVTFVYDGDRAGQSAALKAVPIALSAGLQSSIVTLPTGEDPDSILNRGGTEGFQGLLDDAVPGWQFLVRAVINTHRVKEDPTTGIPRAVDDLAPVLARMTDRREIHLCQKSMAEMLGIDYATLEDFLQDAKSRPQGPLDSQPQIQGQVRHPTPPDVELKLLLMLLLVEEAHPLYRGQDLGQFFASRLVCSVIENWLSLREENPAADPLTFCADMEDQPLRRAIFKRLVEHPPIENWQIAFQDYVGKLKKSGLQRRCKEIGRNDGQPTTEPSLQAITEKIALQRQLDRLQSS
jgi:DNA primase